MLRYQILLKQWYNAVYFSNNNFNILYKMHFTALQFKEFHKKSLNGSFNFKARDVKLRTRSIHDGNQQMKLFRGTALYSPAEYSSGEYSAVPVAQCDSC